MADLPGPLKAILWRVLWLIPLAVIGGGIWLILAIPAAVAAVIGYGVLMVALIGAVAFALISSYESAMRS